MFKVSPSSLFFFSSRAYYYLLRSRGVGGLEDTVQNPNFVWQIFARRPCEKRTIPRKLVTQMPGIVYNKLEPTRTTVVERITRIIFIIDNTFAGHAVYVVHNREMSARTGVRALWVGPYDSRSTVRTFQRKPRKNRLFRVRVYSSSGKNVRDSRVDRIEKQNVTIIR